MPQVKYHTVHKYREQKTTRSKQQANGRAKKRCLKTLEEILDNNKEIRMKSKTVIRLLFIHRTNRSFVFTYVVLY